MSFNGAGLKKREERGQGAGAEFRVRVSEFKVQGSRTKVSRFRVKVGLGIHWARMPGLRTRNSKYGTLNREL